MRVMEHVISGRITIKQGSEFMGLSYRQARHVKKSYALEGVAGLAHRNRGTPPGNAREVERVAGR